MVFSSYDLTDVYHNYILHNYNIHIQLKLLINAGF